MPKLKLGKIDHFAFRVSDIHKSIEFYRDVLNLEFISVEKDEVHGEAFAFFDIDKDQGAKLELISKLNEDTNKPINLPDFKDRVNSPHLAFESNDLELDLQILKDAGVNVIDGPLVIHDMVTWAYFCDPDNNVLELIKWLN